MNYSEYYKKSKDKYISENRDNISNTNTIYDFDIKVINSNKNFTDFFQIDYNKYMCLIDELSKKFDSIKLEIHAGNWAERIPIKNYCEIENTVEDILKLILPKIENSIYNSYVCVPILHLYRNLVTDLKEEKSSWLWHFDHHPDECIKVMFYLTDVSINDGPFEYLCNTQTNKPLKIKSIRKNLDSWNLQDPKYFPTQVNNRFFDEDIKIMNSMGYYNKKITGKKGTIIIFNENIVHKANYARSNHRDVLNANLRPSINKVKKYLDLDLIQSHKPFMNWI